MYDTLLKQWDNLYRDQNLGVEMIEKFNGDVQTAYDNGSISKQDAVHFAALICYLKPKQ